VRQEISLQQGIPIEKAREIVKLIKDSKKKVQASIQGDLVRVAGKDRDSLQEIIALAARQGFRHRHAVHELSLELMARRIESLLLDGPAGKLEALLEEPEDHDAREAVLVCHPHPLHGGTMHNKVVYRIARALRRSGAAVLRFNYRGVNLSQGKYDEGIGEIDDARTALAFLRDATRICLIRSPGFRSDRELP
jgi:predicted alpha/beta-fold hydrolase